MLERLPAAAQEMISAAMAYLPQLAGAILLLIAGWFLAVLLRSATRRLQSGIARLLPPRLRYRTSTSGVSARVLPAAIFWIVLLGFVASATQVLELNLFSQWLGALLGYLPLLLAGLMVIFAGFLLSQLSRELIASGAASTGLHYPVLLSYAGQGIVLLLATVIGLELIGLDTRVLTMLAGIATAALGGGIALAFGLGAQVEVGNRIAARALHQRYRIGDVIRIAGFEGAVLEVGAASVALDTEAGRVDLPARLFSEHPCTVVMVSDDGE